VREGAAIGAPAVRARGVDHVSFAVSDLERSRAFYEGVLGLEPVPRPELGFPGAWYRAGSTEVHLVGGPAAAAAVGGASRTLTPLANHAAFAVDDYAAALARLRDRGLEVVETSAERGQLWVQDPDGNVIELIVPGPG